MLERIKQWFKSHNITTHTVAVIFTGAVLAYGQVQAFHDYVLMIYSHVPAWLQQLIVTALALYSWYRLRSQIGQSQLQGKKL